MSILLVGLTGLVEKLLRAWVCMDAAMSESIVCMQQGFGHGRHMMTRLQDGMQTEVSCHMDNDLLIEAKNNMLLRYNAPLD